MRALKELIPPAAKFIEEPRFHILGILVLGLLLWFAIPLSMNQGPVIMPDEGYYFTVAFETRQAGYFSGYVEAFRHEQTYPPVMIAINTLASFLAGSTDDPFAWAMRMEWFFNAFELSIVLLSSLVLYLLMLELLGDRKLALLSMFLFLTSSIIRYKLYYVHAAYPTNFLALLLGLFMLLELERLRKTGGTKHAILVGAYVGCLFNTHPFTLFAILVFFALPYLLFFWKGQIRRRLRHLLIAAALALVLGMPYILSLDLLTYERIVNLGGPGIFGRTSLFYVGYGGSSIHATLRPEFMLQILAPLSIVLSTIAVAFVVKLRDRTMYFVLLNMFLLLLATYSWAFTGVALNSPYRYPTFLIFSMSILGAFGAISIAEYLGKRMRILGKATFIIVILTSLAFAVANSATVHSVWSDAELSELNDLAEEIGVEGIVATDLRLGSWVWLVTGGYSAASFTEIIDPDISNISRVESLYAEGLSSEDRWGIVQDLNISYIVLMIGERFENGVKYAGSSETVIDSFGEPFFTESGRSENWVIFRSNSVP